MVHDEERSEGTHYHEVLRGRLPPCPLDRRAPTAHPSEQAARGEMGREAGGLDGAGGAGGVHHPRPPIVLSEI
jgi:hypothetical protein